MQERSLSHSAQRSAMSSLSGSRRVAITHSTLLWYADYFRRLCLEYQYSYMFFCVSDLIFSRASSKDIPLLISFAISSAPCNCPCSRASSAITLFSTSASYSQFQQKDLVLLYLTIRFVVKSRQRSYWTWFLETAWIQL